MKILVIGSGGREHALCWRLAQSASAQAVYCSPANAGIAQVAQAVDLPTHEAIIAFYQREAIDLVVIGPEQPLVDGLGDALRAADIAVIGPNAAAAQLEGSKEFTKKLCDKYNIPTAAYASFDALDPAIAYARAQGAPIVIKADGLAAGKGVTVAMSLPEAEQALRECFDGRFGAAGARVVIEAFLEGEEASFFALCDGETAIAIGSAQDHKRAYDGDAGPNTGGMGTYSPAPIMTDAITQQVMQEMILPTVCGMKADGIPYHGFLFAGLMIKDGRAQLIEYNCRMGDPETQVLMPRIEGDFALALYKAATGKLSEVSISLSDDAAVCVVMAAKGYPDAYEKGSVIEGVEAADALAGVRVFHAGTRRGRNCGKLKANGGRVLGVTAAAASIAAAQQQAYKAVDTIRWPQGFCRRDIAWRAVGAARKASA
jgi:phosphoribosylamine---glycine ligase